jgi:hypothetical protein
MCLVPETIELLFCSDRIRTSVNVLGDGFGAGIIHHMTKDRLLHADQREFAKAIQDDIGSKTYVYNHATFVNITKHFSTNSTLFQKHSTVRSCQTRFYYRGASRERVSQSDLTANATV